MGSRNEVVRYIVNEYFDGDVSIAADKTHCSVNQLQSWIDDRRNPQKQTVEYLIHCCFTPEFKVVVEYAEFDSNAAVQTQLKEMLKGHERKPGIYAFYDSMANLLYVGKAAKLLPETVAAIRRDVHVSFPKGIKKPARRHQIVRYVSAYDVGNSNWVDFPKHVESLILRISKPPLNKNIGFLGRVLVPPKEATL